MLKDKNLSGTIASLYICDRCGAEIENKPGTRYRICIQTKSTKHNMQQTIKTYDLCKPCAARVNTFITNRRGKEKTNEKSEEN